MSNASDPIRFGLLCGGHKLQHWQAECVRRVREIDGVSLCVLVGNAESTSGAGDRATAAVPAPGRRFSEGVWEGYLTRFTKRDRSMSLVTSLSSLLKESAGSARLIDGGSETETAGTFAELELDFVLAFTPDVPEEYLTVPNDGVWTFYFGTRPDCLRVPPTFGEIRDGDKLTEAGLVRLTAGEGGNVLLRRGTFETISHSWPKNAERVRLACVEWPAQVVRSRRNGHALPTTPVVELPPPVAGAVPPLGTLWGFTVSKLRAMLELATTGEDYWTVGVADVPLTEFVAGGEQTVEWLTTRTHGTFVADPFPVAFEDRTVVFVEEYSRSSGDAWISCLEYPDGYAYSELTPAFDPDFHVSYPYVFTHDHSVYATPETAAAGEVALYRLRSPTEWHKQCRIVDDVRGVDPTVVRHGGRWWLFCTNSDTLPNTDLLIWHAPALEGPWIPHDDNPVKTDVRSSRPAGRPWVDDGVLYRPAQDCSETYGRRIVVNRVDILTTDRFEESAVMKLEPGPDSPFRAGMHTISGVNGITAVDTKRFVWDRSLLSKRAGQIRSKITDL